MARDAAAAFSALSGALADGRVTRVAPLHSRAPPGMKGRGRREKDARVVAPRGERIAWRRISWPRPRRDRGAQAGGSLGLVVRARPHNASSVVRLRDAAARPWRLPIRDEFMSQTTSNASSCNTSQGVQRHSERLGGENPTRRENA